MNTIVRAMVIILMALIIGVAVWFFYEYQEVPEQHSGEIQTGESLNETEVDSPDQVHTGYHSVDMKIGPATLLVETEIGPQGGSISVENEESEINGLTIDIADNAFDQHASFSISSSEIISHGLGEYCIPLTPLISVENGHLRSNGIMQVTIPVEIPDNHFALAFFYDRATDTLEIMNQAESEGGHIIVFTNHFSDFLIAATPTELLEGMMKEEITTAFEPGKDDWQYPNDGSVIATGGHCNGQVNTMLWYFYERRPKDKKRLFQRYNNDTKDLWQDDVNAYRLASMAQHDMSTDYTSIISPKETKFDNFKKKAKDQFVFTAVAYGMLLTKEPQYIAVYGKDPYVHTNTYGHAVLCYGINKNTMLICDPNFPGVAQKIEIKKGKFQTYKSSTKTGAPSLTFDWVNFYAKSVVYDWDKIGKRWKEFDDGTIGMGEFPEYRITLKEAGKADREIAAGKQEPVTAKEVELEVAWTTPLKVSSSKPKLGSYINKIWTFDPAKATEKIKVKINPGKNVIGIGIYDHDTNDQFWAGFEYLELFLGPVILAIDPESAIAGTTITITGSGFGSDATKGKLLLNGIEMVTSSWSDTSVSFELPDSATSGQLSVTVNGITSNAVGLTMYESSEPTSDMRITNVGPQKFILYYKDWKPDPMRLMINGENLGGVANGGKAMVCGMEAQIIDSSDQHIEVLMPVSAGDGQVVVYNAAGGASNAMPVDMISPDEGLRLNASFDLAFAVDFEIEEEIESPWAMYTDVKRAIEERDMLDCDVQIQWDGSSFSGKSEEILSSPQVYGVHISCELKKEVEVRGSVKPDGTQLDDVQITYKFPFASKDNPEHYYGEYEITARFNSIPLKDRSSDWSEPRGVPHMFFVKNGAFEEHLTDFSIKGRLMQFWNGKMRETRFSSSKPVFESQDIITGYSMALKRQVGNARW